MIQFASKQDADEVIPLMEAAIGNIAYTLTGTENADQVYQTLKRFFLEENNRLSYKHILVSREEDKVVGMLLCYAGDDAARLDEPIANHLRSIGAVDHLEALVTEALPGDYYLDSIAVDHTMQGRGIAKELMTAFEQIGYQQQYDRLSLIVEPANERAYALYTKQGYQEDGVMNVSGKSYIRMIKQLT